MFARPGRSVFVCFRCQSRLADQFQRAQWLPPINRTLGRWQSAAVAVAEDFQDLQDDQGHPRPRPQSDNKFKAGRVWKPNRTAQLGVSSLGMPAEVLLLNERDRMIPKVPTETEEGREGNVLAAAWSTENQSLSAEQLRKNIEQIRDQARQVPEKDPEGRRGRLRKRLHEGFSAKQLRNYIEQTQDEASKPWHWKRHSFSVKIQMARYIFKYIWGIHGPDIADATGFVEAEKSRQVQMSPNALEVLLLADNLSLRQIAEDHRVKIDFFRQPSKILVSGPSSSVDTARESLLRWQKKLVKHSLDLGAYAKGGDKEDDSTLLAEIRQLHNVHVVGRVGVIGRKRALQICYHEDTPPDLAAIRRHVLLAQRQGPLSSLCTVWPKISSNKSQQVFLGQPGRRSKGAEDGGKRLVASSEQIASPSMPQMSDEQKSSFSEIYKANREALAFSTMQLKKVAAEPGMRLAYRAYFGQALNDDANGADFVPTDISQRTPSFTSQIPLLSQFLAKRKPWKDNAAPSSPSKSSSESANHDEVGEGSLLSQSAQFNYELTLSSASQAPSFPRLSIQLVGADLSLGLKQPLQISAISAVLAEKASYLFLPSQAVDIKYESQILCDIYRAGSTSDVRHATLLSQLAKYFDKAGSLPEPEFAPFTTLSIPGNIRPISIRRKAPDSHHEYILESATALDLASYRPPFLSKLCLEHVVFLGDDHGAGRQVLQLAEGPRFSTPSKQKNASRFAGFFNSAYEIARFLGDPTLLPTRKS